MINLFVEFGFQPLNMEALLDFKLIERSSIINNFEARDINLDPRALLLTEGEKSSGEP